MKCTSKRVEKTKTHPCNLGERRWACLVEAEMKGFGRGKRVLTQVFLEYLTQILNFQPYIAVKFSSFSGCINENHQYEKVTSDRTPNFSWDPKQTWQPMRNDPMNKLERKDKIQYYHRFNKNQRVQYGHGERRQRQEGKSVYTPTPIIT